MDVRANRGVAPVARASRRLGAWAAPPQTTRRSRPRRACSIRWSAITSRRSGPRRLASMSVTSCRGLSRRSSGGFSAAASSPAGSRGFAVDSAGSIAWWRFPVRAGPSVRVAAAGGSPSARRISSMTCFRSCPCGNGSSVCRIACGMCSRGDHVLCRAVSGVFVRAVLGLLRRARARTGVRGRRGGAVAIIQRFGAALNLNVPRPCGRARWRLCRGAGALQFHEAPPPTDDEMDRLLRTIDRQIHRLLARRGVPDDLGEGSAADWWREEAPVLAGIAGASVHGRRALGERAGASVRRCRALAELLALSPSRRGPCHARGNGFDLHAAVFVPPRDRARLERLCRYALRPPIATDRIAPDRRRAGGARAAAPLGGRDDTAALRAGGVARTAGSAHRRSRGSISCCITASSARDRRGDLACGRASPTHRSSRARARTTWSRPPRRPSRCVRTGCGRS